MQKAGKVSKAEPQAGWVDPARVKLHKDRFRLSGDGFFFSIQGEGKTTGCSAVFMRLHVCNLRCVWCDSFYTWDPASREFWTESYELSVSEAAEQARSAWACANPDIPRRLVITGGEPLLQKELLDEMIARMPGWIIEIETNGTLMPTRLQLETCQLNCSPKLENSDNSRQARIQEDVLRAMNKANAQFKFVVMGEEDIDEIIRDFVPFMDPAKIVLMPQGTTSSEIRTNAMNVVERAKREGFRLMTRLHVELWGAKRKV